MDANETMAAVRAFVESLGGNVVVNGQGPAEEDRQASDRMVIRMNSNAKMSRGKYAAQAVHAALILAGVHHGGSVVVLGAKPAEVEAMTTVVRDAGRTELEPGTLTAGASYESARGAS